MQPNRAARAGEQYLDARSSAIQCPARIAVRERLMKALRLRKCDPLGRGKSVPLASSSKRRTVCTFCPMRDGCAFCARAGRSAWLLRRAEPSRKRRTGHSGVRAVGIIHSGGKPVSAWRAGCASSAVVWQRNSRPRDAH